MTTPALIGWVLGLVAFGVVLGWVLCWWLMCRPLERVAQQAIRSLRFEASRVRAALEDTRA